MRIKALALAAGVVAGLAGFAGVAQADSTCPDGNVCLWSGANYTGARFAVPTDGRWPAFAISSVDNGDDDSRAAFYYDSGQRGACFTVAAGGRVPDLTRVRLSDGSTAYGRLRSLAFNRTCGPVYGF
jgi:peptidase inhibitor family I36